jgi:hypothetical protein
MRTYEGVNVYVHASLTSTLVRDEWSASRLGRFNPGEISAVCIATAYGLDDREVRVGVPVGSKLSFLHIVQTGSGAHPASYPVGTVPLSPVVKQ